MAVIILNVSEDHGIEYGYGLQIYELKINNRKLCTFYSIFEEGLVECLRNAADAFEAIENEDKQ